MEAFVLKNVSFKYPNSERIAVNNISLTINQGDFVLLCGKSGCGKTTLLKLLKPSLTPFGKFEGSIFYNNLDLSKINQREDVKIGYVMQNPDNQIVTDKVWHELAFGLENLGLDNATIRLRVSEICNYFNLTEIYNKNVCELSGGQKQILNLASIMAMQPSVIILDEPTSQLDPITATSFLETIYKINRDFGTTIIISEQRLTDIYELVDKVIVMDSGKIALYDTPVNVAREVKNNAQYILPIMPSSVQIYSAIGKGDICPITVREGKMFVDDVIDKLKVDSEYFERENFNLEKKRVVDGKENAIALKNICFKYDINSKDVLKELSFKVKKGSFCSLLGGNGAGKTTLINLLNGVNRPHRGSIFINGKKYKKISGNDMKDNALAILPQNVQSLFLKSTAREELKTMLSGRKLSKEEVEKSLLEIAKIVDIESLLASHPYDLSGGEQQRLALAKVLLLDPQILILDEPTKGIDGFFKEKLGEILLGLASRGVTILMISHDIEFSARYAEYCALLFDGGIISEGQPNTFFGGNSFYTTSCNKISRHIIKNAILSEEVVELCKKYQKN